MEKYRYQIIGIISLFVFAIISFAVIAPFASSVDSYEGTISALDEKKDNVLKLTAASTATSVAITFIPGDAATPIAEKLADLSSYFLIVLCAIYLEKYLLTITGFVAFKILIPVSCILFGINLFTKNASVKKLATKFAIFGIAIFLIIPASIRISAMIETTYADSIETTLSEAEQTVRQMEELTGTDIAEEPETENSTEIFSTEETEQSFFDKAQSFFKDAADKTSDTLNNVSNTISDTFSSALSGELLEKSQEVLNRFLEAVAVMIITSCVIPILVLVFFVWITKMILEVDIQIPTIRLKIK